MARERRDVGILHACYYVPESTICVDDLVPREATPNSEGDSHIHAAQLGIKKIHVTQEETSSDLALTAARQAIDEVGIDKLDIDVIVDFSVLPEDHVVPSWSLSNRVQAELGARNAFTIGFSGGATSNMLVAMKFCTSLFRSDPDTQIALLVAGDKTIQQSRVLNPDAPVTCMGDIGSAILVKRGVAGAKIQDVKVYSNSDLHDVYLVPGGGIALPNNYDLYRVRLDFERYQKFTLPNLHPIMGGLVEKILEREDLDWDDISYWITPNISTSDKKAFATAMALEDEKMGCDCLMEYGHLQGNDLIINYLENNSTGRLKKGDYVMLCSHGFGFVWAAALMQV